jgi:ABC-type taurine transport system ATPase subunit
MRGVAPAERRKAGREAAPVGCRDTTRAIYELSGEARSASASPALASDPRLMLMDERSAR